MRTDLHIHTTASDGAKTPSEIAEWARGKGLELIAVTDHDTVAGIAEARRAAREAGIAFLPGIEISAHSNCEVHILGYNVDETDADFAAAVAQLQSMRKRRNALIGDNLRALGIELELDFGADGLGRLHIAQALVKAGYASEVQEAFDKYVGPKGSAYAETRRTSPFEAVKLITAFGGAAVIAHPKKFLHDKTLEMLINGLKPFGLKGLETYYPKHSKDEEKALCAIADKYGLIRTGGSDYHGDEDRNFVFNPSEKTLRALKTIR